MIETEPSKAYDPTDVEGRWYQAWLDAGVFTAQATSEKPPFCIVLPPPNITGSLHLGHALTATIQDILSRWKRMSGYNVLWLPGTDHAGIATQMVVERELKKTEGKSRHDLGRKAFIERVWEWKEKYGARIGEQHKVLGASLDWTRERFTMDEGLSRAVREVFVRLYEEGLIYRAEKLINWCPQDLTALSDLEVEHEERKGSLWHIRYPVAGTDRFLTVATTRPETMLGDTAVAVHPEDPRYADLIGRSVVLPLIGREIPIIGDAELVNMEFGTGVVKVTPAHDFNDYQTGLRHRLPMVTILDEHARTNAEAGPYAGLDRFEARKRVLADLAEKGLLEKEEPHALSIGTCQRCATVVEPRLSPQWFVRIEPLARPAIQAVEEGRTRFVPESWTSTYFSWMRNIHDWTISRQLWWGHQIPAYYCKACSPRLGDDTDLPLDAPTVRVGGLDFGRAEPIVARVMPTACPKCGGTHFEQDPDVLDTWFSSGLWAFSTLGWPDDTPELRTFYPTSIMETGHDIIFFWVARMMMMGLHFMNDVPFHTVYLHALVRDEKGEKMSKTKGNVIDPLDVIRGAKADALAPNLRNRFPQGMPAFGADALRFTLASLTQQGRDIKLSLDRVAGYKAFGNKLWNASRFALMNMGSFRWNGTHPKALKLTLADRWILARLDRAVEQTRAALESLQFAEAANTLYQFLWYAFCDWYIELSKPVLYGDDAAQRDVTRSVLVFSLDRILRLLHPFMPFITEELWQRLPMERPTRFIGQAVFPEPDERLKDPEAEAEMAPVVEAIEGLRNIRGETNLPPSARISAQVQSADARTRELLEAWRAYLMPLAGLGELRVGGPGKKPAQAAAYVGEKMEIFVPLAGLIDFEEEKARLKKELSKTEGELAGIQRKLDNPNFVAKAPADVVEADRARVAELGARKAKLQENLMRISEPAAPEAKAAPEETHAARTDEAATGPLFDAGTAGLRVTSEPLGSEDVNLAEELRDELAELPLPKDVDPQVREALEKLREGTREGLSARDRYDLGVALMGMGLVDDAAREFAEAKKAEAAPAAPRKAAVKQKAVPATKAAARKAAVKKAPAKK
ncbi:MAG: valine--tRNA ligase, partial [Myxococcaceae bacterium]|nr:valine--tRNA ligase [Myxococcaceae bacterium]